MRKPEGILRQERFLTAKYSQQVYCPSCRKSHSLVELRGGTDWSKDDEKAFPCPNTRELIQHGITLFGAEQFWDISEPDKNTLQKVWKVN